MEELKVDLTKAEDEVGFANVRIRRTPYRRGRNRPGLVPQLL